METRLSGPKRSRIRGWIFLAGLALVPALAPQTPAARPPEAPGGPGGTSEVRILARNQEKTEDRIFASGDVEVHFREFRIFADRVEYNIETRDVLAEGNVVAQSGSEVIRAERALFNLETGRGKVEMASGVVQPSIFFEA